MVTKLLACSTPTLPGSPTKMSSLATPAVRLVVSFQMYNNYRCIILYRTPLEGGAGSDFFVDFFITFESP